MTASTGRAVSAAPVTAAASVAPAPIIAAPVAPAPVTAAPVAAVIAAAPITAVSAAPTLDPAASAAPVTAATHRAALYGLVVDSDVDLHQERPPRDPDAVPDVVVRRGAVVIRDDAPPPGAPVLRLESDGARYSASRADDGSYVLRFHRTCEFRIAADLRHVTAHPVAGADPRVVTILTTGGLLAFLLYLRGHLVLHASAVDLGGSALGFVGSSGMGKSTMAALQCADGAALVTDDVLRVDWPGAGGGTGAVDWPPVVRLGATELRLRKGADTLAGRFGGSAPGRRTSADARHVLRLRDDAADHLPLRALVIPYPVRDRTDLTVEALTGREAAFALVGYPRLLGWQDREVVSRHFGQVARLVERVPVLVARVPWGPPFADSIAAQLREAVDQHVIDRDVAARAR